MNTTVALVGFVLGFGITLWVSLGGPKALRRAKARARGTALAKRVWAAYKTLESHEPGLPVEERRVRALFASGWPEEDVRTLVARSVGISPLHATLTMLTVGIAVQEEGALNVSAEVLNQNIFAVQRAVMDVIPLES